MDFLALPLQRGEGGIPPSFHGGDFTPDPPPPPNPLGPWSGPGPVVRPDQSGPGPALYD